jgi:hypothetical protein
VLALADAFSFQEFGCEIARILRNDAGSGG